jgi:predicted ester cyclase
MPELSSAELLDPREELVRPMSMTVDASLDPERARHLVRIAQTLYTFWDTGDVRWLHETVDPSFTDNTLPGGRPQGIDGPAAVSAAFRAAVPDLACELSDLLVTEDKLTVRLRFTGHFSGTYNGVKGEGQRSDFIAFDIQHVGDDRITEDWHLEDNLTFLTQAGVVSL